jgi:MurNAc alpha-1-phosphate uridylyltransferase
MEALAQAGFAQMVINTAWLGDKISDYFGHSGTSSMQSLLLKEEQTGLSNTPDRSLALQYSHEGRDFGAALETAGGIARALPMLDTHFWVLAGDVYAPDFVFSAEAMARFKASGKLAHLWLVPNPAHNLKGDFGLSAEGLALNQADATFTFSTVGLYRRELFMAPWCDIPSGNPQGVKAALAPLLRAAMAQGQVSASIYIGAWTDVGTPERLASLG